MSENTENTQDTTDLVVDELTALKSRADQLGISYHPSIGLEKLRAKVNDVIVGNETKEDEDTGTDEVNENVFNEATETPEQRRARKRKEANTLIRIRLTCMNPAKKEWEGELITAGNGVVGSFSKFVPFNAEEGYYVPQIIFNQLKERQCQIFVTKRDKHGNSIREGKLIREFAIEVLPNLTIQELKELAQQQAMRNGSVD